MKLKNYFIAAALSLSTVMTMSAQQPYAGCWFPDDVRDWTPEYDKDAKFNRSRVPLKQRITTPEVMKANAEQGTLGRVMLESVSAKMCGQCAAQGFDNFIGYNPTYWQYVDKLVNWGGADDEGIIVLPPAGTIDAAHAQGVKVFATIFFQTSYNGKAWANQITNDDNGKFPYAEQLYKIAKYYGFDGYFINDESGNGLNATWEKWIKFFYDTAEADGDTNMEIVWYNASSVPNVNILNTHPRTSHFLDYGAEGDYRGYAAQLNCTEEATFSKIYAGVECARGGLIGYNSSLNAAFPRSGEHVGSLALFCPEQGTWKDNVDRLFFTPDASGEKAYEAMRRTFASERDTWIGRSGNPSEVSREGWRGFSGCIVEQSTIDAFPFISSFNVGNGKHRFAKGVKMGTRDWSHSGMQSYLPTWRYWIENGNSLSVSIDWDDAYSGGNSMLVSGTLATGSHMMRLYKTMASCNGGTVRLVYKSNNTAVPVLHLSTASSVNPDTEINAKGISQNNEWTVAEYDLASVAGKTIYMVAFDLKADATVNNYEMRLGQINIIPAGYSPAPVNIENLTLGNELGDMGGDMRVTWDWAENADLDHFDIYTRSLSGKRTLVGQTRDEGFYIPAITREGTDSSVDIIVIPVMKDGSEGTAQTQTAGYPQAQAPKVTLKSETSYVKVGQVFTLTAEGTYNPDKCKWTLPDGLMLAGGCDGTEFTIKVKATAVGKYGVKAELTNEIGTGSAEGFAVEVLSANDYADICNVALKKEVIEASASDTYRNVKELLVDGDYTLIPWRSSGKKPYAVVDLGEECMVYGFGIFDCNSAGQSTYKNINNYTIEVSADGTNYSEVVNATGRMSDNIKRDYIEPVKARYVRFSPYDDLPVSVRIYEFEVYGCPTVSLKMDLQDNLTIEAEAPTKVTVNYDLNGMDRADNFNCNVIAANSDLSVSNVTEDKDSHTFTFDVTGIKKFGTSSIKVTLTNGEMVRERTINVSIDVPDAPNAILGLAAEVRKYDNDYTPEATFTPVTTNALTDGDTKTEALSDIETPSTFKYDVWAVVDAGKTLNLSKLKIHIPDNNRSVNNNDEEGYVNNDICLKISDNGTDWTDVATFEALEGVSELQYIFPDFCQTRYIAVACNLNVFFYASLAEIEAYEQVADAILVTRPLTVIKGFNYDVIAETSDFGSSTNGDINDIDGVFYTRNVDDRGAIAGTDRIVKTKSGMEFMLGDYSANNCLKLTRNANTSLEFAESYDAEQIHLLICSDAKGAIKAYVNYTDGSEEKAQDITTYSYYSSSDRDYAAVYGLSLADRFSNYNQKDYNYLLTEATITADMAKTLKSIRFTNNKWVNVSIMAVSVTGRPAATSGIDSVEAEGVNGTEIEAVYNLQGVRLEAPAKGINIIRYTDGTTRKVIVL